MIKLFFAQALLPEGWAGDVAVEIAPDGTFASVEPNSVPAADAPRAAIAVPGMANVHSHAFQRGMAGLAERAGPAEDSFWTWREVMYGFLDRLTPDDVEAIAGQLYVEMLEAGFTAVGEFHYLHNDPRGRAYADPAELAERIVAASETTGIALTHLPVLYHQGGFGAAPPTPGQRRFVMDVEALLGLAQTLRARHPDLVVGAAPHSLRAVTPESLRRLVEACGNGPLHIHAAEQEKEVRDCLAWSGRRPVRWLLDEVGLDARWCLVHCTHLDEGEVRDLAASTAVVGLCPVTEANLGDGIFRGVDYLASGGRFGIGSDSHIRIDLADELRSLEYSQRLRDRRRNRLAAPGHSVGRTLFEKALSGGAQALAQDMGAIVVGRRADIVTLDPEHPALVGRSGDALLDGWIFAARTPPVDTVRVGGRLLVEGGLHVASEAVAWCFERTMRGLLADA